MQILIANGYVRENKGDAALISVLATQLQTVFPRANIVISGMEDPSSSPDFYGYKNVGSLRLYQASHGLPFFLRIARRLFTAVVGIIWPLVPTKRFFLKILPSRISGELRAIENSDLIISCSGGYLSGKKKYSDNQHIFFTTLPLRIAQRMKKPVIMGPESYGPLNTPYQRKLVKKTLEACQRVFVRENKSYQFLKALGINEDLLYKTVDSGFAFASNNKNRIKLPANKTYVGITARNWLTKDKQLKYEYALADFIVYIEKTHNLVGVLVPQVSSADRFDDDREVESRINQFAQKKGANPIQITDQIDHFDIKNLYSKFAYTVGTRFHSVIFSLTSMVPAIAIEYEHKTSGIMQDLDLEKWVIKIEDVTSKKLIKLFEELHTDTRAYKDYLAKAIPPYVEKSNEVPNMIKRSYDSYVATLNS